MTDEQIRTAWAMKSDLARSAAFTIQLNSYHDRFYFVADVRQESKFAGRKTWTTVRAFSEVPRIASDADIEEALAKLHTDLVSACATAP